MAPRQSFIGKPRERKTRTSVRFADRASRWVITVCGIGTIVAVSTVLIFLISQVVPLFLPATRTGDREIRISGEAGASYLAVDEDRRMAWRLTPDYKLQVFNYSTGDLLATQAFLADVPTVTAVSPPVSRTTLVDGEQALVTEVLFGSVDGTVRRVQFHFHKPKPIEDSTGVLDTFMKLEIRRPLPYHSGLLIRTPIPGRYVRLETVATVGDQVFKSPTQSPVRQIAYMADERGVNEKKQRVTAVAGCWQTEDGKLALLSSLERVSEAGELLPASARVYPLAVELPAGRPKPDQLRLSHDVRQVFLLWNDDTYQRVNVSDPRKILATNLRKVFLEEERRAQEDGQYLAVDESKLLGWILTRRGRLKTIRMDTGAIIADRDLFAAGPPMAVHSLPTERSLMGENGKKYNFKEIAFGFLDGSIRVIRFRLREDFPFRAQLPQAALELDEGEVHQMGNGLVVRTPADDLRVTELALEPQLLIAAASGEVSPVRRVDQMKTSSGSSLCYQDDAGRFWLTVIREKENRGDGTVTRTVESAIEMPYTPPNGKGRPDHVLFLSGADQVLLIWNDGSFQRFDVRRPGELLRNNTNATATIGLQNQPVTALACSAYMLTSAKLARIAEIGNLLPRTDLRVTQVNQLIGRGTTLIGDNEGTVHAWFLVNATGKATTDSKALARGHELPGPKDACPVTGLAVSDRTRLLAIAYADGTVRILNVTSEKLVTEIDTGSTAPLDAMALLPKENGLVIVRDDRAHLWEFKPGHPEITLASLFLPVWYEGSEGPVAKWEASSGTDEYEPKFGMWPLIFGTLKATFYSLLFGVPLALLAAIYTSEFMRPRTKAIIKPTIETMASLPSVVLGFLAALVFAVFIENIVPTVLTAFITVPLAFVLFARLWQLLPEKLGLILTRNRVLLLLPALAAGLYAATLIGPAVERWFFGGDIRGWLAAKKGDALGGWLFLFLPLSVLLTSFLSAGVVTPFMRRMTSGMRRNRVAWIDLVRFLLTAAFTVAVAYCFSLLFASLNLDARGSFIGEYSQRNALVVGFIMGFAIIPIIFTITDDALSAVPQHLRSGSLACGATPWQTATRIVIPTAMSGIFSAIMIGMGRAIGETMIVVMATGNTPVLEWNVFNGFRTLSANIAVEIPEAVKDSTHYRTLFLAALILFAMTFFLNTIAEVVRLRFRRRAYQL